MGASDGVACLHRYLGTVKRTAAGIVHEVESGCVSDTREGGLGFRPFFVATDRLTRRARREFEVEVVESKVAKEIDSSAI
jgi:hypothetical protein